MASVSSLRGLNLRGYVARANADAAQNKLSTHLVTVRGILAPHAARDSSAGQAAAKNAMLAVLEKTTKEVFSGPLDGLIADIESLLDETTRKSPAWEIVLTINSLLKDLEIDADQAFETEAQQIEALFGKTTRTTQAIEKKLTVLLEGFYSDLQKAKAADDKKLEKGKVSSKESKQAKVLRDFNYSINVQNLQALGDKLIAEVKQIDPEAHRTEYVFADTIIALEEAFDGNIDGMDELIDKFEQRLKSYSRESVVLEAKYRKELISFINEAERFLGVDRNAMGDDVQRAMRGIPPDEPKPSTSHDAESAEDITAQPSSVSHQDANTQTRLMPLPEGEALDLDDYEPTFVRPIKLPRAQLGSSTLPPDDPDSGDDSDDEDSDSDSGAKAAKSEPPIPPAPPAPPSSLPSAKDPKSLPKPETKSAGMQTERSALQDADNKGYRTPSLSTTAIKPSDRPGRSDSPFQGISPTTSSARILLKPVPRKAARVESVDVKLEDPVLPRTAVLTLSDDNAFKPIADQDSDTESRYSRPPTDGATRRHSAPLPMGLHEQRHVQLTGSLSTTARTPSSTRLDSEFQGIGHGAAGVPRQRSNTLPSMGAPYDPVILTTAPTAKKPSDSPKSLDTAYVTPSTGYQAKHDLETVRAELKPVFTRPRAMSLDSRSKPVFDKIGEYKSTTAETAKPETMDTEVKGKKPIIVTSTTMQTSVVSALSTPSLVFPDSAQSEDGSPSPKWKLSPIQLVRSPSLATTTVKPDATGIVKEDGERATTSPRHFTFPEDVRAEGAEAIEKPESGWGTVTEPGGHRTPYLSRTAVRTAGDRDLVPQQADSPSSETQSDPQQKEDNED